MARSGPLPTPQAAELTIQVLSALAHAHSMGVVHRDLKPQNIMITETGATKIMDFGIARVAGTEHLTSAGLLMGTPAYMAPEQVMGGEIDTRTDLYSVGVVLYHLLTGKLPFKGETPMAMVQSRIRDLPTPIRAIRQDLPAWISIVMERALERAADRRFQSADEMRDALRRGLSGLPVEVPGPLLTPPELIATVPPGSSTWATHPSVPPNPTRRRLRHADRHRVADAFRPVGACGLNGRAGHRPAGSGLARTKPAAGGRAGFFRTGPGKRIVKDTAHANARGNRGRRGRAPHRGRARRALPARCATSCAIGGTGRRRRPRRLPQWSHHRRSIRPPRPLRARPSRRRRQAARRLRTQAPPRPLHRHRRPRERAAREARPAELAHPLAPRPAPTPGGVQAR